MNIAPQRQTQWDGRAAANFAAGGAGAGLAVATALASPGSAAAPWLLAAALVAAGLLSVWFEIGRPWRALNVLRAARRSWMTREALAALLLLLAALAAGLGLAAAAVPAALAGLAFVYCQGRILVAARGIPAWREPLTLPLIVATGLAEGAALLGLWALFARPGLLDSLAWACAGLTLARFVIGARWYRRLSAQLSARPLAEVNRAGHAFNAGNLLALAMLLVAGLSPLPAGGQGVLQALAMLACLAGGLAFKWQLVTRAAFNQGFAIVHPPVRGVRRAGP